MSSEFAPSRWPTLSPRLVFGVLMPVYFLGHLGLRLLEGSSLRWDECEQTLFTQQIALGYNDQPPVYTWLLWTLMRFTGVSLLGVYLFKSLILAAIYLSLYAVSRRLMPDAFAIPATLSLLLTPYFAWSALMDGAHTPFVTLFAPVLLIVVFRLIDRPTSLGFAILGIALGFGFLAKYSFVLLALALPAAMFTIPRYRARLLDPRLLFAVVIGALIVMPHTRWVLDNWEFIRARPMERGGLGTNTGFFARVVDGLGSLGLTVLLTVGPLIAALLVFFPNACLRSFTQRAKSDEVRLVGRFLAIVGFALLVLILLGVSRFRTHWLIPIMVILPVYVLARAAESPPVRLRLRGFLIVVGVAVLAIVVVRVGRVVTESGDGGKEWGRDRLHETLAQRVTEKDLGRATFIGDNTFACGNLRVQHPDAKIVCTYYPAFFPANLDDGSPCYFIWDATIVDRPVISSREWIKSHGLAMDVSDLYFAEIPTHSREKNLRRIGMIRVRRLGE